MTAGRPTKYKKAYCQQIIKFMSTGASLTEFAADIDVSKDSVYEWAKTHEEFSDALSIAKTKCQAVLEKMGRLAMVGKLFETDPVTKKRIEVKVDYRFYHMIMKGRFDDWKDKTSVDINQKNKTDITFSTQIGDDGAVLREET